MMPTLNPANMSEYQQHEVAKATIKELLNFFDQPEVQKRFEEWKRERGEG